MGDLVLISFAERLRSVLRASTAARLGGDEFGIVCENTEPADAEVLADRLRTAPVTDPLSLGGTAVSIGLSIGIGSAPEVTNPGTPTVTSSGRPTTRCTPTRPGAASLIRQVSRGRAAV